MTALGALRADESVRPPPLIQRLFTLLFRTVRAQKLRETEALLELHRILCHGNILLSFKQMHYRTTVPVALIKGQPIQIQANAVTLL
jgi:hypothetical protein